MTKPKFTNFRELMQTRFPEEDQVKLLKRPNAIRFTLDDFQGDIHISELQTEEGLLSWIYYFCEKTYMTGSLMGRFIRLAAEARGLDLHNDFEDPSPLDIWFESHKEITVKQYSELEGITERQAREKLSKLAKKRELRVSRTEGRKKFYAKRRAIPA